MSDQAITPVDDSQPHHHNSLASSHTLLTERAQNDASSIHQELQYNVSVEKQPPLEIQLNQKSRRAPCVMLIGLILGLAISLAHHLVDKSLNGRVVADVEESIHLSQSWILSINTLLAFMVKTSFTAAVGDAFVQRQWWSLHRNAFTIRELDNITSILRDQSRLVEKDMWKRVPLLAAMALVSWILPFAVIYPPGALTIGTSLPQSTIHLQQVPQLNWTMNPAGWIKPGDEAALISDPHSSITVPFAQPAVRRIMHATASGGQMLSLTPKYANESYHLDFVAPNLDCILAADEVVHNATVRYGRAWDSYLTVSENYLSYDQDIMTFAAWTVPPAVFFTLGANAIGVSTAFVDATSNDTSRIFFMSNDGLWDGSDPRPTIPNFQPTNMIELLRVNVTECKLYNASYSVDFEFEGSRQTTTALVSNLNPVSFGEMLSNSTSGEFGGHALDPVKLAYLSIMESFGLFLIGEAGNLSRIDNQPKSNIDLVGNIDFGNPQNVSDSMINLFQNFTLSLLTEPLLSNETWSAPVPVTVKSWPIIYIYTPKNLLIAYSTALVTSLICCLVGMHAFMINDNSFQNLLSTYLRATNEAELRSLIINGDIGADPLPEHLGQARLSIVGCGPSTVRMMSKTDEIW